MRSEIPLPMVYTRRIAEDGLWVLGAGARKQARRRAAKLAMVVAESLGINCFVRTLW